MNISRLSLCISLLVSIAFPAQALSNYLKTAGAAALVSTVFVFNHREPKRDAKSRFDLEKLKDIEWAKENPKEWSRQFWFFYYDVIIGQGHKSKKLVLGEDGKTIVQHDECVPFGLMGKTSGYLKAAKDSYKMLKSLVFVGVLANALQGNYTAVFNKLMGDAEKNLGVAQNNPQQ